MAESWPGWAAGETPLSKLAFWFERHGRDLPWRRAADPYAVWISEIMLQQTTVATVRPYFERFLVRFSDVAALAAAEESEVLRLWEGLGYYSRARNLRRAAQSIRDQYGLQFPRTPEALQELPGIGRYTAGAIVSFAFNQPAPIVEANTLRLYSRLMGLSDDPRRTTGQRTMWQFAELLAERWSALSADRSRTWSPRRLNAALMDLGALVCLPEKPLCTKCPLAAVCEARRAGTQASIPCPPTKPAITLLTEAAVAIVYRGQFLLRQRTEQERWAGLWDFPRVSLDDDNETGSRPGAEIQEPSVEVLIEKIEAETGVKIALEEYFGHRKHAVTRYRITLHAYRARHVAGRAKAAKGWRWCSVTELATLPLSTTGRQLAQRFAR